MTQFDTENKDVLLAMAIASGRSASAAATQLGISLSTVQRRMAEPSFRRLVADLRGEMVAAALGRMAENMTRAADAVSASLDDADPRIRIRAARALFTFGLKLRDSCDLGEQIRQLEAELARKQGIVP